MIIIIPGIEPNVRDFEGDTALSHACCCGSLGVAKLLVAKRSTAAGSTSEDLTVYGEKSLGEGVVSKKEVPNPEVEADLGEDAINNRDSDEVNKVDMDHDMPGIRSKEWNEGTDINTGDLDGVTPLHKAIANNWGEIVDLLLEQPHLKVIIHHCRQHHLKTLNPGEPSQQIWVHSTDPGGGHGQPGHRVEAGSEVGGERELRGGEPLLRPHDRLHARLPPHC